MTGRGDTSRPWVACALVAGSLFLCGVLDLVTGVELRVYPLYYIPLALAGGRLSRPYAISFALVASFVWGGSNYLAGMEVSAAWIWGFNLMSALASFLVFVILFVQLREQTAAQHALARTDALTALPNARAFFEAAEIEIERQRRYGGSLSAAYLDLDDFKKVNEELGHLGADDLLAVIASAMRAATRRLDVVARLGGDEFAVLLPHTAEADAHVVLDRLRETVRAAVERSPFPVTFSIGAIVFAEPPAGVDDLLRNADALMFQVKQGGKDGLRVMAVPKSMNRASSHPLPLTCR